jgi:hypothetical protein
MYVLRDSETNNIISIKSKLNVGDLRTNPKPIVEQVSDVTLELPGNFYLNNTRPKHIILTDVNTFTLMPGTYLKKEYFNFTTSWVNDVCTVTIYKKISGHYEVRKEDGVYENLTASDLDFIIMNVFQESIDETYNETIEFKIGDKDYSITLVNGVATFELDYSKIFREHTVLFYDVSHMRHKLHLNIPNEVRAKCILRENRDKLLAKCDWLVIRHTTQLADSSVTTTLSETEYADLLTYMQALRDLPENTTDPFNPVWPTPPSFV